MDPPNAPPSDVHAALSSLDLNLLVTLDALLEIRNVTETAERFGVTQSAMSHRLARLRELFDDPLLVSAGDELVLTSKAQALQTPLRHALEGLRHAVVPSNEFDPETSNRAFVLASADLAEVSLLPVLLQHLAAVAPSVRVRMAGRRLVHGEALALGRVDLAIAPREGTVPGVGLEDTRGIRQRRLFDEGFSVLVRRDHPRVRSRLTLERFVSEKHVLVAPQGGRTGLVDAVLAKEGRERHIAVQVASFLSAPFLVADTDYLLTCPTMLAERTCGPLGLRALKPPITLPRTPLHAYWHERAHHDPGHRWFREELFALVARRP